MEVFRKKAEIRAFIDSLKQRGKTIGFVPTMGALHEGHLSLIESSKKENDLTIASIFVNPIQFNNNADLLKYPRDEKGDIQKLEKAGCDTLFMPDEKEMYPEKAVEKYDLGGLDEVMEGRFRPGHFQGVAVVVMRLFNLVPAHNAYFGKKDFQQLSIIKYLVKKQNLNINIIGCETIREKDGLAKSSRNLLLEKNIRENVKVIPEILMKIADLKYKTSIEDATKLVFETIDMIKGLKVEYFEIVDEGSLRKASSWDDFQQLVACIAVWAGEVRLIDNVKIKN